MSAQKPTNKNVSYQYSRTALYTRRRTIPDDNRRSRRPLGYGNCRADDGLMTVYGKRSLDNCDRLDSV